MADTERGEAPPVVKGKGRRERTEVERPPLGNTPVPGQIPSQIMKIIESAGHIDLSRLPPTWKAEHPDTPLAYREWGYERLRDYITTLHASIVMTPNASGRDFVLTMPGTPIPEKALVKKEKTPAGATGANAVVPALAEIIAANGGDAAGVARVLKQAKYRFTIEALAREVAIDLAKPAGAGRGKAPRGKKPTEGEAAAE
uniref:Uncharacterized protein n=1 Tax=Hemiselmis tepida TaxID=464990 RepID=A0A7S0Z265_9CRYP|mmetsp:Transcript_4074/g.10368  ORF Transcript_4074/g.10368 Transcript_4074/m.10368 type:complete len:200 (+) Transcript_4074:48-647(+)|eukprot:CAMPEP_0174915110 /NCGR_PEP_ID=MMETSP1355-20121228/134_1 /TAXON_ID=464990 /ORGANISM="Hemiselmis tepida, Strain CCMP443" /LENGTH=199 /DNA_ID=CAMNT_0016159917 /DNA_START=35 /DNA_END=634 /DNA_ORIENTATION=+